MEWFGIKRNLKIWQQYIKKILLLEDRWPTYKLFRFPQIAIDERKMKRTFHGRLVSSQIQVATNYFPPVLS